jgi:proteic killer suppression protein
MIRSFRDDATACVFRREPVRGLPPEIQRRAYKKLFMLHSANALHDLRSPPGNMLEALRGDRAGQHSIRVNDQWRICFVWRGGSAEHVELVDYHWPRHGPTTPTARPSRGDPQGGVP